MAEGASVTIKVTLNADPERTVTIPLTATNQNGASTSDYAPLQASVVFNSGDTEKTFSFTATADNIDDDDEKVKLSFGELPARVANGDTKDSIVSITDDDDPPITVQFGAGSYSVDKSDDTGTSNVTENEVAITVTLSADPERTVTIPLSKTDQGGATSADYSGVPTDVSFDAGETSKTFTFTATADTVDDDGESAKIGFGTLPTRVAEGTTEETAVSITDDDHPEVQVNFAAATYTVPEGGTVKVTLSASPERAVTIPLTKTEQGGAVAADYSVPTTVPVRSQRDREGDNLHRRPRHRRRRRRKRET